MQEHLSYFQVPFMAVSHTSIFLLLYTCLRASMQMCKGYHPGILQKCSQKVQGFLSKLLLGLGCLADLIFGHTWATKCSSNKLYFVVMSECSLNQVAYCVNLVREIGIQGI